MTAFWIDNERMQSTLNSFPPEMHKEIKETMLIFGKNIKNEMVDGDLTKDEFLWIIWRSVRENSDEKI